MFGEDSVSKQNDVLKNKIDFVALIEVNDANPNGDPLLDNRPRTTYDGRGEISDVCIKRKIRNRFMNNDLSVFVQSDSKKKDNYTSLQERFENQEYSGKTLRSYKDEKNVDALYKITCELWDDVRAFGTLFAFKGDSFAFGVTGAVTINQAKSVKPVDIYSMQITKSTNSEAKETGEKASDTMGTKEFVVHGLYVVKGSISAIQAEKNGYTEEDAENLKEALRTLFYNDASAARPDGSMRVAKLFWFTHKNSTGSAYKTHSSVKVTLKEGIESPTSMEDYKVELAENENFFSANDYTIESLPENGILVEVIEGE